MHFFFFYILTPLNPLKFNFGAKSVLNGEKNVEHKKCLGHKFTLDLRTSDILKPSNLFSLRNHNFRIKLLKHACNIPKPM